MTESRYADLDPPTRLVSLERGFRRRFSRKSGTSGSGDPANLVRFAPASSGSGATTVWWNFSPRAVVNMLERLGFTRTEVTFHTQRYRPDHDLSRQAVEVAMFTVVGHRGSS